MPPFCYYKMLGGNAGELLREVFNLFFFLEKEKYLIVVNFEDSLLSNSLIDLSGIYRTRNIKKGPKG